MFQVRFLHQKDFLKIDNFPSASKDVEEFELPPSKYNDEMTKACEKLEANLKKLDDIEESRKQREMELKANEKK